MSKLERAKAVLSAVVDKDFTEQKALELVHAYASCKGHKMEDMDDEAKAGCFLMCLKADFKSHCQSFAIGEVQRANSAAELAAQEASDADFA